MVGSVIEVGGRTEQRPGGARVADLVARICALIVSLDRSRPKMVIKGSLWLSSVQRRGQGMQPGSRGFVFGACAGG